MRNASIPGHGVVAGGEANGVFPAGLEPAPRALAVGVARAVALHEQPSLRRRDEPDERVAAFLRTPSAGGPIFHLFVY